MLISAVFGSAISLQKPPQRPAPQAQGAMLDQKVAEASPKDLQFILGGTTLLTNITELFPAWQQQGKYAASIQAIEAVRAALSQLSPAERQFTYSLAQLPEALSQNFYLGQLPSTKIDSPELLNTLKGKGILNAGNPPNTHYSLTPNMHLILQILPKIKDTP